MREQATEPAAGAGDHHPLPGDVAGAGERRRGSRSASASSASSRSFCTDQYNTRPMFGSAPTCSSCTGGCCVIRGFEQRVAGALPRRRGARLRAPLDRAGGVGGRRVLAAARRRRDHLDAPRPRPLPRQGPRPARDVRRADGARTTAPTAAAAARCTSPTRRSASSAPTASSAPGLPIAVGAATAAQLRRDGTRRGRVLRRRRGRAGRVPRGGEPRRGVASCRSSSSARTTATPSSRPRRRSTRRRSSSGPRATASTTSRSTATTSSRPPPRCSDVVDGVARRWRSGDRRGDDLPVARPLRGRPASATAPTEEVQRVGGARPARRARAPAPRAPASTTTMLATIDERRSTRELDAAVEAARGSPRPTVADAARLRRARRGRRRPEPPAPADDAPVFRTMDAIRTALEAELATDERVFVAGIDVGDGGNVFGLTRGLHDAVRRPGARHADLRDRDHGPRGRRGDGGHAAGRRAHVPRLRRRVPRPAAQPGGEAAVHDRRRGRRWR